MGGPMPLPDQTVTAFGAAANLVHPATGFSVSRSFREAPAFADELARAVREGVPVAEASRRVWGKLWPEERRAQVRGGGGQGWGRSGGRGRGRGGREMLLLVSREQTAVVRGWEGRNADMGHNSVVLVGVPDYWSRHGRGWGRAWRVKWAAVQGCSSDRLFRVPGPIGGGYSFPPPY